MNGTEVMAKISKNRARLVASNRPKKLKIDFFHSKPCPNRLKLGTGTFFDTLFHLVQLDLVKSDEKNFRKFRPSIEALV